MRSRSSSSPSNMTRQMLEAKPEKYIRRYARYFHLSLNLSTEEILDVVFQGRPTVPRLKADRSFRKGIFESNILMPLGVSKAECHIMAKTEDRTFDPHRDVIARTARVVEARRRSPRDSEGTPTPTPTPTPSPKPTLFPSSSRSLRRGVPFVDRVSELGDVAVDAPLPLERDAGDEPATPEASADADAVSEVGEEISPPSAASPAQSRTFPIEHYPSPPADTYYEDERNAQEDVGDENAEVDDETSTGRRDSPPYVDFVYPPVSPLDASDPHWVAKMLTDLQRQRNDLQGELDDVRRDLQDALADASIAQGELKEECNAMQTLLNILAKIVGQDMVRELIETAESYAVHGPPADHSEDDEDEYESHHSDGGDDADGGDGSDGRDAPERDYNSGDGEEDDEDDEDDEESQCQTGDDDTAPLSQPPQHAANERTTRAVAAINGFQGTYLLSSSPLRSSKRSRDNLDGESSLSRPPSRTRHVERGGKRVRKGEQQSCSSQSLKRRREADPASRTPSVADSDDRGTTHSPPGRFKRPRPNREPQTSSYTRNQSTVSPAHGTVTKASNHNTGYGEKLAVSVPPEVDLYASFDSNFSNFEPSPSFPYSDSSPDGARAYSNSPDDPSIFSPEAGTSQTRQDPSRQVGLFPPGPSRPSARPLRRHQLPTCTDGSPEKICAPERQSNSKSQYPTPQHNPQNRPLRHDPERLLPTASGGFHLYRSRRVEHASRPVMRRVDRRFNTELGEWEVYYPDEEDALHRFPVPRPRYPYEQDLLDIRRAAGWKPDDSIL